MIGNFGIPIVASFLSMIGSFLTIAFLLVPLCYVAGIIICGIGLGMHKKSQGVENQPYKVLRLLGLIFNIIGLVMNIISVIIMIIAFIILALLLVAGIIFFVIWLITMAAGVAAGGAGIMAYIMQLLSSLGIAVEEAILLLVALL